LTSTHELHRYSLDENGGLFVEYKANTDKPTLINMVNHIYFNLGGHDAGSKALFDHVVNLNSDFYTPCRPDGTPTGEIRSVGGSPFDLRTPTRLEPRARAVFIDPGQPELYGFDHNFVVARQGNAFLEDEKLIFLAISCR